MPSCFGSEDLDGRKGTTGVLSVPYVQCPSKFLRRGIGKAPRHASWGNVNLIYRGMTIKVRRSNHPVQEHQMNLEYTSRWKPRTKRNGTPESLDPQIFIPNSTCSLKESSEIRLHDAKENRRNHPACDPPVRSVPFSTPPPWQGR